MKTYYNPDRQDWPKILARPTVDNESMYNCVMPVLEKIRLEGDAAIKAYTAKFDGMVLDDFSVSEKEIISAEILLDRELKEAITIAAQNIRHFHKAQKQKFKRIETVPGVVCWQKQVAIENVGLYIPGGTAPLFSTVLMLAIPAQIAGCRQVIMCTPPGREGVVHPAILYAAKISGVSKIFKIGGIQAIGAMAYGTDTVPKTDKIFGPGNQYVMAAKQLVSMNDVATDMPAGPSEVAIIADGTANPAFLAADLLSQAEHGSDSQVILITGMASLVEKVINEIGVQISGLTRKEIAEKALENSRIIVMDNDSLLTELINFYAPEHLIIATADYNEVAAKITNAGSVFLGNYSPESAGDYASGTNHTLPTNGWARSFSGVNLDSFMKKITFQEITREGLKTLGPVIETMAEAEHLTAHKNAVTLRLNEIKKTL